MPGELSEARVVAWVDAYERAWRDPSSTRLGELFTDDATYVVDPYAEPVRGLPAIEAFWTEEIGPDEVFTMTSDVLACSGTTGVARIHVEYGEPVTQEYLDLWVMSFADDGRVSRFEEWPFWPSHGRSPSSPPPVTRHASDVPSDGYTEVVRSAALSAGVYRLAAGADDGQLPHAEDEVYVVTAGSAQLEVDGERTPVRPGAVAYVPRLRPHRFVDITEDLEVAVVFAPPESR